MQIIERGFVPTVYADGFGDFQLVNGILRCTGFMFEQGDFAGSETIKISVIKLLVSIAGADAAQMETERILREQDRNHFQTWRDGVAH